MQFAGFDARMRLVVLAGAFWATCAPLCLAQIDKAEDQYTVAASHYKGRRYALAVSEFEAFMKRYPEHARKHHARFYLAESYVQTRRLKEAEPIFDRLLTDKPDYPLANHALYRLGEIAYFREQHEVAMKRFESFVRQFPQDRLLEYVLPYQGQLYLRANKPKQAQAAYLSSLERFPNGRLYEEARMGLAQAFEVQNNFAEARRFYKSIAQNGSSQADIAALRTALTFVNQKQWRPALKELEQFCRDRGKSGVLAEATYWRGRTLSALERHDEAAKHFSEVRDRFPQHALAAESGVLAAEEYRDANQLVLAKTGLEKVLAEHRKSEWADDALQLLIEMAWDAKEYQVVGRHAERFHREFPESGLRSRVRELHGRALLATGKFEDAIELLREILAEADGVKTVAGKQDDLVARRDRYAYYLGVALLSAERFDESLKALERVKAEGNRTLRLGLYSARGAAFFGLKRFDKSIEPLQQCLKLEPKGEDATKCRLQLAIAFAEQKQWTDALDTFEQMKQLDRKHDKFLGTAQFLAERFFTGGEYKSARKLFAVLSEPGNPESYIEHGLSGKAWCDHVMSAGKGSSEGFERLIKRFPDGKLAAEAAMMRANWLEEQGQHEAAIGLYQFVVERHTQTTYAPRALLREAQIHDKQQRDLKAAELLRRLLKDYPKFDRRDSVLYTLAWVLDEGGRSEQADEVFEQLYKDHKTSKFWADATYRLAERAARSKNYDRAAELIQRVIVEVPQSPIASHALFLQGQIAAMQKKWELVGQSMTTLRKKFPRSDLALPAGYWLAESLYRQEQYEEAETAFAVLESQTAGRQDSWVGMIPLRRAQALAHMKRWNDAREIATPIAKRFPKLARIYEVDYLLGRCHSAQGKFTLARESFRAVTNDRRAGKTETAAMAQWMIGETFFMQKNYQDAIREYHRVVALYAHPTWQSAALLQTGKCHEALQDWKRANETYEQLMREFKDTTYAGQAQQRIRVLQEKAAVKREQLNR